MLASATTATSLPSLSRKSFNGKSVRMNSLKTSQQARRRLIVEAAKEIECQVEKPTGVKLAKKGGSGGGVVVQFVTPGSNAAKAGMKMGDQVIYHSSFFGDELWPADNLPFTNSAINACPDQVDFIVVRGADVGTVDVKRLKSRPPIPKFGRKLSAAQKERATHICVDCGFIYYLPKPFEDQPPSYICPQCQAPKGRFFEYDVTTGEAIGGGQPLSVVISGVIGLVGFILFAALGLADAL